jgi:hypothetical protein
MLLSLKATTLPWIRRFVVPEASMPSFVSQHPAGLRSV